jgi:hypothetical protein
VVTNLWARWNRFQGRWRQRGGSILRGNTARDNSSVGLSLGASGGVRDGRQNFWLILFHRPIDVDIESFEIAKSVEATSSRIHSCGRRRGC